MGKKAWIQWGGMTPAERRILCWIVGLLLLGVIARAVYHSGETVPPAEKIDVGSTGSSIALPL